MLEAHLLEVSRSSEETWTAKSNLRSTRRNEVIANINGISSIIPIVLE